MNLLDEINCGLRTVQAHVTGRKAPLSVYLNLTARCSLRCSYCNYPNLGGQEADELTTDQVFTLIDQMADAGTKKLQLTGGEPFLRSDIGEIVRHSKKRNLFTSISASGFAIPKRIKELIDIDLVYVSLDGDKETHDSIRGKNTYDMAYKAIQALKANGVNVWTTTVVNRLNRHSIDFMLQTARKLNLIANFVLFYHADDGSENHLSPDAKVQDFSLTNLENKEVIRELIRNKKSGEPIGSSLGYLNYLLEWEDLNVIHKKETINNIKCWAGKLFCHISEKGILYPCGTSYWRVEGQDALKMGFQKAFDQANNRPCDSCIIACHLEHNLLFSLSMETIYNWFKVLRKVS